MYVCICFGVTDTQVGTQIEGGARSVREIAAACRAGTDCGRCVKTISAMIPRDDTRSCNGCTKRCGRICRADRDTAAAPEPVAPVFGDLAPSASGLPRFPGPLTILGAADPGNAAPAA
ncbi:(2Fe-2S)-binding protein [Yinghuangia sp. ASG 101]|uniref:(2Fe-2S)-binding protein n=1 Tax=Yinghuangia sp. ASG 101 TaxID=2896848 RepID=UPI0022B236FC|nr:(2Fe-2S)-binding protein [Yinghuangia sp. ASG 101]